MTAQPGKQNNYNTRNAQYLKKYGSLRPLLIFKKALWRKQVVYILV